MINSWRKEKGHNRDTHRVNVNTIAIFLYLKLAGGYSDVYVIILYTKDRPTIAHVSNLPSMMLMYGP